MADIIENAVCTAKWTADGAVGSCKTAGSCCTSISAAASSTTVISTSKTICVLQGTLVTAAITLTTAQQGLANSGDIPVFATAACPAYTAGASTLAVSAAALATAVYMM